MVLNKVKVKETKQSVDLLSLIYTASHDLKGSIRTIKSFTQILNKKLEDKINDNETDMFRFIFEATEDLELLVVQLVTYSKIGQTPLTFVEIEFGNFTELMKLNLQKQIQAKDATVNIKYADEKIKADREKLGLVLNNLTSNALKFQPKDQKPIVDIEISDKNNFWEISVKDNGIGMNPEDLETIFLPFEKLHGNAKYKGAGIGLAICDQVIKDHNGTFKVESELNKGSTFTFTLPK